MGLLPVAERRAVSSRVLLAAVGIVALVPFILLIAVAFINRFNISKQAELDRLSSASQALAVAVDRELKSHIEKAQMLAGLRSLTDSDPRSVRPILLDAKKAVGGDFVLLSREGHQLASTRIADGASLPQTKNRNLVDAAVAAGRPVVSDLALGTVSRAYEFGVFVPFRAQGGELLILAYIPSIGTIQRLSMDQINDRTQIGAVVDGHGRILARTEQSDRYFGQLAGAQFFSRLKSPSGRLQTVDLQNRASYTAYHASTLSAWKAVVWVPEATIHAPGWEIAGTMGVAGATALMLSLLLGHFIAGLVRRPIDLLLANARDMGRGLIPVPERTWMHEANLVSAALNDAAKEIAIRQAEIERTTSLARQSETRFRELVAGLRDAVVWEGDPETLTFTYVSDAAEELLGFPSLAWTSEPTFWIDHVHPEDRQTVAELCRTETAAGHDHEMEYRMIAADGRTVWVRDRVFLAIRAGRRVSRGILVDITKWKQAESVLRERERFYCELTENAPVMLWISDEQGRCLHLNKRLRDFWGVGEDLTDFDWSSTMHPEDAGAISEAVIAAIAQQRSLTVQGRYKTASGAYRVLKTEAEPRYSESGAFVGMLGANIDVTESVAAAAALKESEERLRIAARTAGLGVFEWRIADNSAEFENARMLEILGHAPDDRHLSKQTFMATYIHPDDAEAFEHSLEAALTATRTLRTACRIRRKSDGVWRWVEVAGNVLADADGLPDRLIGVAADITERKQAEDELMRTSALLRAVSDGVNDLIFVKDRNSRFMFANPATARVLGTPNEQLIGSAGLDGTADPAEVQEITANDRRVIESETAITVEETLTGHDGRRTYFSNKAPLRDSHGKVVGVVGVMRDISERKAAEEHTELLLREVSHRAKNLLAVTQSIVRQTARDCDPATFAENVNGRLAGLAASHDLLVERDWRSVALRDLIVAQLPHFQDLIGERLIIEGPEFELQPAATQTLGMALHELATNASKYGAFSNDAGTVQLTWRLEDGDGHARLELVWRERGGPPVAPPQRQGFGHAVITRLVEHGLDAVVTLNYETEGFEWRITAPSSRVISETRDPAKAAQSFQDV